MSAATLAELRKTFPGRFSLRANEVALLLRGRVSKRITERIRDNMRTGVYGAGARKIDGVWQLPLTDLAEVLEPTPPKEAPETSLPAKQKGGRRRSKVGPYLVFIQQAKFWVPALRLAAPEDADAIQQEAERLHADLVAMFQREKAERIRAMLTSDFGDKGIDGDGSPDIL